jgi:hypothetical protein
MNFLSKLIVVQALEEFWRSAAASRRTSVRIDQKNKRVMLGSFPIFPKEGLAVESAEDLEGGILGNCRWLELWSGVR